MKRFSFRGIELPEATKAELKHYVETGEVPSNFMQACIDNNLHKACCLADESDEMQFAGVIMAWLHNEAPRNCWGTMGVRLLWQKAKRLEREAQKGGQ